MEEAETILALDLATQTGWAVGKIDARPLHGSQRLGYPGSPSPEVFASFLAWLVDMIKVHSPRVLVYEAPLPPSLLRGKTNVDTARRLMGLPAIAEAVAQRMSVSKILEARVDDVRQHFIGRRNLPGAEGKAAVKIRCRQLGFDPKDDNAADAIALWDYTVSMRNPKIAALRTPLFEKGLRT